MPDEDRLIAAVNDCLVAYRGIMEAMYTGAPEEIRDELMACLPSLDDPRLTADDIRGVTSDLPAPLPPSFQAYLLARQVERGVICGEYRIPTNTNFSTIDKYLHFDEIWPSGYMAFASREGDPVCFDFQAPAVDGEYPVIVFNHDTTPRNAWSSREKIKTYEEPLAPTFLAFLQEIASGRPNFLRWPD
ncbi:MAG: SMI1/KNR4 family protein [Armatimonadota bacterium]